MIYQKNWWKVGDGGATYVINGEPQTLPNLGDAKWEVHSKLLVSSGPNLIQTLKETRDEIDITYPGINEPIHIKPAEGNPISIKTNYLCQVSTDEYTISIKDDEDSFKVKVFKDNTLKISQSITGQSTKEQALTVNNFGKLWTKISWKTLGDISTDTDATINISTAIPTGKFGMLMIYYLKKANQPIAQDTKNSYLTLGNDSAGTLAIYNYKANDSWWNSWTNYYLRPGINCIKIPSTVSNIVIHKNTDSATADDTLILSSLDIVDTTSNSKGVNYSLLGIENSDSEVIALLEVLRDLDPKTDFYYNCQIENSNAIDLNDESETMATETIWYDYNNVNNKFVISEIDADYLETGITLTRSSKL